MTTQDVNYPEMWTAMGAGYDPNKHMIQLKGRDYLNVQNRLVWFIREQRQMILAGVATRAYIIRTEEIRNDTAQGYAEYKTYIRDVLGCEATMYGSETARDFPDYAEKASTKSLGRALLLLGYGTSNAIELDEGERVVDAPVENSRRTQQTASMPPVHANNGRAAATVSAASGEYATIEQLSAIRTLSKASNMEEPDHAGMSFQRAAAIIIDLQAKRSTTPSMPPDAAAAPPANGVDAMATDRQMNSIRKLCTALRRPAPDMGTLTFVGAKEMLTNLSHAYSESRQANEAAPSQTTASVHVEPATGTTTFACARTSTPRKATNGKGKGTNALLAGEKPSQERLEAVAAIASTPSEFEAAIADAKSFGLTEVQEVDPNTPRGKLIALANEYNLTMRAVDFWKESTHHDDSEAYNLLKLGNRNTTLVWGYGLGFSKYQLESCASQYATSLDLLWDKIFSDAAKIATFITEKCPKQVK